MEWSDDGARAAGRLPNGIRLVEGDEAVGDARALFKEGASSLGFDVPLREFARELAGLPGDYAAPAGALLVALRGEQRCGCVAMRALGSGVCEVRRLHVRHPYRSQGLGRRLIEAVAEIARDCGYRAMRIRVLPWMRHAIAGSRWLGFEPIPPDRSGPDAAAQMLELDLTKYQPHRPRVAEEPRGRGAEEQRGKDSSKVHRFAGSKVER